MRELDAHSVCSHRSFGLARSGLEYLKKALGKQMKRGEDSKP